MLKNVPLSDAHDVPGKTGVYGEMRKNMEGNPWERKVVYSPMLFTFSQDEIKMLHYF